MVLNHRIEVQQRTAGQDAAGQPVDTWATVARLWADVRLASGQARIKADAQTAMTKASIRVRRRTDITPGMRVLFDGATYAVDEVVPDYRDRLYMDLVCEVLP